MEENLIHKASDGVLLRSKSELMIYERLLHYKLNPIYEKKLMIKDVRKIPDFTIDDSEMGITYYREHLGMLSDPEYLAGWNKKKNGTKLMIS